MKITPESFFEKYSVVHKESVVNGKKIHWVEFGSGKPLIGLHGLGGSWTDFWSLLPAIKKRKCYLLDLPGCGLSEPIKDMSVKGITKWLYEFSKRIKEPFILESICTSSQIAILFENSYPKKVEKQIMHMPLLNGKFNSDIRLKMLLVLSHLPNFLKKAIKDNLMVIFQSAIDTGNDKSIRESAELDKKNKKISDYRVYSEFYIDILNSDFRKEFLESKNPCLILAMEKDDNLPIDELKKISKDKTVRLFSNSHSWNEKTVIWQNKEVLKFL